MIRHLEFKNFKVLRNVVLDLERLTVLVGPNGCGKSSILEGVELLTGLRIRVEGEESLSYGRPAAYFRNGRDPALFFTRPSEDSFTLSATSEKASHGLTVSSKDTNLHNNKINFEGWRVEGDGETRISIRDPHPGPEKIARFFNDVFPFGLDHAFRYRFDARMIAAPSVPDSESPSVDLNGARLPSVLDYLLGTDRSTFDRIVEDLREVVPQVRGIRVLPAKMSSVRYERVTVGDQSIRMPIEESQWGKRVELDLTGPGWLPLERCSEGTLIALAVLTTFHSKRSGSFILLDDIDRALHPTAQGHLLMCLRRIMEVIPDLQVLCTSHSPYLLDHFKPEEVRVMNLDAEGYAVCRNLVDHPDFPRWEKVMSAGEFWSSTGEAWTTGDVERHG